MDKETIIRVSNRLIGNSNITQSDVDILIEYCLEHGKPINKVIKFIHIVSITPNGLYNCLLDALNYYQKKFEITEISKENLKLPSGKEIIKYY
jgi:hypothetical protein